MTTKAKMLPLLVLGLMSAGCSVADKELAGYQDPGFGDANRATYAAMVVNPDPVYEDPIPETSAQHAVDAIDRYRNDAVKQPENISTTEGTGGPN